MTEQRRNRRIRRLVLAVAGVLLLAGAVAAQAGDYFEEVRDGRIHVFVTPAAHEAWKTSGEMGAHAVTRLDYGPKGETVLFESADAVAAYDARHPKADGPPNGADSVAPTLPFQIEYRMPGLRLSFPKAEINWTNRMQLRFTRSEFENFDSPPPTVPSALLDNNSFRVRRMRIKLDGWIYTKALTWELQYGLEDNVGNGLQDANLDYDFAGGKKAFRLKAGQFKVPFSWQQLASSTSLQLVDRSFLDPLFAPGRDIGVQLWGLVDAAGVPDFLEWRAGIFNGAGRTVTVDPNDEPEYTARLVLSPWGGAGYTEANLERYTWRVSIAGEYDHTDRRVVPASGPVTGAEFDRWGASIVLKALESLFFYAQYYGQTTTSGAGVETDQDGYLLQGGLLITPRWEIAARYAVYDPDTDATVDNDTTEKRVGASYYINLHNWKIQADYGVIDNDAAASGTNRRLEEFRLQAQLIF